MKFFGFRLILTMLILLLVTSASFGSFNPPSGVRYSASAYADRAKLANATGTTALASYLNVNSTSVNVNLFSQDISCSIPLLSLLGRAGLNLNLGLSYNSKIWILSGTTMYFNGDQGWPAIGWRLGFGRIDGVYTGADGYKHYYLTLGDGSVHDLRYDNADGLYESIDSTYMDFNDSSGILRFKDGTQVTYALIGGTGGFVLPTKIKDRNGNFITINYVGTGQSISSIVDSVGRLISFSYNGDGTLASVSDYGFGHTLRSWSLAYANTTLNYSFASSLTVSGATNGSVVKMLSSLTFPNNSQVRFSYNAYAQLIEADFFDPAGNLLRAKYLASWQATPSGGWIGSPVPASVGNFDGTNPNDWSLSFGNYQATVTDPAGVTTMSTFLQTGSWDDGLPSEVQVGSPVLRTVSTAWGNDGSLTNQRPTSITTTLNDSGQQSQVQLDYTSYGNVSETREYDYGLVLARRTDTSFVTDTNYTSRHILGLPSTTSVYDGSGTAKSFTALAYDNAALVSANGAANHDDTSYGTGFIYRGLATTETRYTNPSGPSGAISHNSTYDMLGNLRTADADCCVVMQYNFSSATQFSQPDSIVRGSGSTTLTTTSTYDGDTGLVVSSTDPNNQTTHYNFDTMNRSLGYARSDGTVIGIQYLDNATGGAEVQTTTPVTSGNNRVDITQSDGLGRPILISTGNGASEIQKQYDGLGRVTQASVPYTGAGPNYWTQYQYDSIGRVVKTIPADGTQSSNNVVNAYSGNTVTTTDEAGKQREEKVDAFGRVVEVDEPDPANNNSLTLVTTYSYDPLGDLTKAIEGSQTRSYTYDGLSRLTQESMPESGVVTYAYNNYSKVTTRTDARNVVTVYSYDGLNRPTQLSYTTSGTSAASTPSVGFTYGANPTLYNNGKLVTLTDGLDSDSYTYDQLGRKTQCQRTIYNVTYTTAYTYDLAGNPTQVTYPSGRVLTLNNDAIGRLMSDQNHSTQVTYLSLQSYNPANQVTGFQYANNIRAAFGYTQQRFQLNQVEYGVYNGHGLNDIFNVTYGFTQNGGNNGQITSITDSVASGRTVNYTYDSLNRLTSAVTTGSTSYPKWGLSWTYDRYGNRTSQTVTAGSGYNNAVTVDPATNRVTAMAGINFIYDASGNLIQDDLYKYTYDAENRLVEIQTLGSSVISTYAYDGYGQRSVKVAGTNRTFFLYSGGRLISEFSDSSSASYTPGTTPKQAPSDSVSLILYQHPDQLTTRMTTDNSGTVASQQGHYPYGDLWYAMGTADPSVLRKFTSYYKDTEVAAGQLHYAMAREYSGRIGRFHMADPVGSMGLASQGNLYSYAVNDPINHADPSGLNPNGPNQYALLAGYGGLGFVLGGGTNCTLDGISTDCGYLLSLAPDQGVIQCPFNNCNLIFETTPNGYLVKMPENALVLNCVGPDLSNYGCFWAPWSLQFVENGNDAYFVGDARWQYALHLAGQMADSELKSAVVNMVVGDILGVGLGVSSGAAAGTESELTLNLPPGWNSNWLRVGTNWFDEAGGEWRWHAPDAWHDVGHWDYNPWTKWNSPWQNIPPY